MIAVTFLLPYIILSSRRYSWVTPTTLRWIQSIIRFQLNKTTRMFSRANNKRSVKFEDEFYSNS